eukprot:c24066_g1_i1 orf=137-1717(+)
MEDASFKSRVQQAFGALRSSSTSQRFWSVSEQEVERREWKTRQRDSSRDNAHCGAYYEEIARLVRQSRRGKSGRDIEGKWEDDLEAHRDENDMDIDHSWGSARGSNSRDEEGDWRERDMEEEGKEMRMMVGLDSTLDFEDEEDTYDKVAIGREGVGERLYMKDVQGSEDKINSFNVLPCSLSELRNVPRDPRANHLAARERLDEDSREAGTLSSRQYVESEQKQGFKRKSASETVMSRQDDECLIETKSILKKQKLGNGSHIYFPIVKPLEEIHAVESVPFPLKEPVVKDLESLPVVNQETGESEPPPLEKGHFEDCKLSSIEDNVKNVQDKKLTKRVRFVLHDSENSCDLQDIQVPAVTNKASHGHSSVVPDYVRNPSKYIHYTLDWSDEDDEKQNVEAFKSCQQLLGLSNTIRECEEKAFELPGKLEFRPRRKDCLKGNHTRACHHAIATEETALLALPAGIAAGYALEEQMQHVTSSMDGFSGTNVMEGYATHETVTEEKPAKGPRKYRSKMVVSDTDEKMEN